MSEYKPIHDGHAIEQAVVGLRLFEPASDDVYGNATACAERLAKENDRLPGKLQVDPMALFFGRQVISSGYVRSLEAQPGVVFHRVRPDGSTAEELTVERTAVTFRTHEYRRWSDMVECINHLLIPVARTLANDNISNVSVIELRCIDRFNSDDQSIALSELVRSNSPYVPHSAMNRSEMQHVHCGWFEDTSPQGRRLININIDVADEAVRSASIFQMISRQSSQPGALFDGEKPFAEVVIEEFNEMHQIDKRLLAELLTDELQSRIQLFGSGNP